jgi:hypothetical protein
MGLNPFIGKRAGWDFAALIRVETLWAFASDQAGRIVTKKPVLERGAAGKR